MKSFDTMEVGRTRSMRHSRKPSGPMTRRTKQRSWRRESRGSRGKRLSSRMKTKKAIGTRKNPREMTVRRQKSRVEDEMLPQAGCRPMTIREFLKQQASKHTYRYMSSFIQSVSRLRDLDLVGTQIHLTRNKLLLFLSLRQQYRNYINVLN